MTVLTAGQGVLSRLHDLRRLRDLSYLDPLEALHREIRCRAGSVADRLGVCPRCFDRWMRSPEICQRP